MNQIVFNNYSVIEHKLHYMLGFLHISEFEIFYRHRINSDEKKLVIVFGENSKHYIDLFKIVFSEFIEKEEKINDVKGAICQN